MLFFLDLPSSGQATDRPLVQQQHHLPSPSSYTLLAYSITDFYQRSNPVVVVSVNKLCGAAINGAKKCGRSRWKRRRRRRGRSVLQPTVAKRGATGVSTPSLSLSLSPSLRQPFVGCTSRSRIGRQEQQQQQQQLEVIEVGKRSLVLPVLPFDIHALH